MSKILVFGHKNPDNDAIMSAVVYSQLASVLDPANEYVACRLGEMPGESAALLEKHGVAAPQLLEKIEPADEKVKVVLTDHNELGQTVEGIENAEVVGVIDHHRIADLTTAQPTLFINVPWGSTCCIIAKLFEVTGTPMSDAQAAMLLAAMMTDTVMLKSPTTTDADRAIAAKLGTQIGVDPVAYGAQVFKSRGADGFTPAQMVARDIKKFEIGGKAVFIGQYETVNKEPVLAQADELRSAMEEYRTANGGDTLVLCVTDIIEEGSQVFVVGEPEVVERGLNITVVPEGVWMPGVLSRKKQVAAPLIEAAN